MSTVEQVIADLGSLAQLARLCKRSVPTVSEWRDRGEIPAECCPTIERALHGKYTCEQLQPTRRWVRIKDPTWPHRRGRPLCDFDAEVQARRERVAS